MNGVRTTERTSVGHPLIMPPKPTSAVERISLGVRDTSALQLKTVLPYQQLRICRAALPPEDTVAMITKLAADVNRSYMLTLTPQTLAMISQKRTFIIVLSSVVAPKFPPKTSIDFQETWDESACGSFCQRQSCLMLILLLPHSAAA